MTVDPRVVGRRIAEARQRRGWSQMTLALEAKVTPSTVSRWERGRMPRVGTLMRIADILGIDPAVLVVDELQVVNATLEARVRDLEERLAALEKACPGL